MIRHRKPSWLSGHLQAHTPSLATRTVPRRKFRAPVVREQKEASAELRRLEEMAEQWNESLRRVSTALILVKQQNSIAAFEKCQNSISSLPGLDSHAAFLRDYRAAFEKLNRVKHLLKERGY